MNRQINSNIGRRINRGITVDIIRHRDRGRRMDINITENVCISLT